MYRPIFALVLVLGVSSLVQVVFWDATLRFQTRMLERMTPMVPPQSRAGVTRMIGWARQPWARTVAAVQAIALIAVGAWGLTSYR